MCNQTVDTGKRSKDYRLIMPNIDISTLLPYLILSLIVLSGGFLMSRWFRRNKSKKETSEQYIASRLRKLEQQMNDLQKTIEGLEHRQLSQRNLEGRLEKLERRVFTSERERSVDKPDLDRSVDRDYQLAARENRSLNALQSNVDSSTSLEDYWDDTKIEEAISVYKQQSSKSGDLFVPLPRYFAELEERRISVDEMESRNILDMVARRYPGSVRIELVRGKPDKQIAILDEYLNHQNRR